MNSSDSVEIMEKDTASQTGKQEVYEFGEIESQTSSGNSPSLEERISKRKLLPRQVSLIGYVLKPFTQLYHTRLIVTIAGRSLVKLTQTS